MRKARRLDRLACRVMGHTYGKPEVVDMGLGWELLRKRCVSCGRVTLDRVATQPAPKG